MLQPVKTAFGQYMGVFYSAIVPTTKSLQEYVVRGLAKSIVWAPSRMIDAAEDMLAAWMKNDTDGAATHPADMPVIIVAMAKDYMPTGRDYTRQVSESVEVILPDDAKERAFNVRTIDGDVRAQIAIFAHDEPTAKSLASQFLLHIDAMPNRRFDARYTFAGQNLDWPVQIESPDSPAMSIQSDAKNLTILAVDITLKAHIPLFQAPKDDDPNDGKGTPGDANDPSGYPVVTQVDFDDKALDKQTTVT